MASAVRTDLVGALAGRINEPTRVSVCALARGQRRHAHPGRAVGAPRALRRPAAEVRNTRTNVGIIDVTPLGKLDLQGPDVPKLLNLLYTNKWTALPIGGVRYGLMCAEDGVVLDDGVTARLGEEHYLMTTTSSGAAKIWNWIEMWLQTEHPDWQVHVTPVTTGLTSINIAGRTPRELLGRLTADIDLDPAAFPYMNVRRARSPAFRTASPGASASPVNSPMRSTFPRATQCTSGSNSSSRAPISVWRRSASRRSHHATREGALHRGPDTDGLSKAPVTGLNPLLKLDKDDWAGMPEVAWTMESGDHPVIVACQPDNGSVVPEEAAQILRSGTTEIVGRVTSSRMSPTLNRSICLAQVTKEFAAPGTSLEVLLVSGERITATVQEHHAHFDPEETRLRG